jgi:hypothetical protein
METPTLLDPLERANLNQSQHLKTETHPVSGRLCSLVFRIPDVGPRPEIQYF